MNVVPIRVADPVRNEAQEWPKDVEPTVEALVDCIRRMEARLRRMERLSGRIVSVCPIAHQVKDG